MIENAYRREEIKRKYLESIPVLDGTMTQVHKFSRLKTRNEPNPLHVSAEPSQLTANCGNIGAVKSEEIWT